MLNYLLLFNPTIHILQVSSPLLFKIFYIVVPLDYKLLRTQLKWQQLISDLGQLKRKDTFVLYVKVLKNLFIGLTRKFIWALHWEFTEKSEWTFCPTQY